MKKLLLGITSVLVCCSLAFVGCRQSDEPGDETDKDPVYSISLSESSLALELTKRETLTATLLSDGAATDGAVEWRSSDENVVSVSNGTVTAIRRGSATITASALGVNAECAVTVTASYLPSLQIGVGDASTLAVMLDGGYQLSPYIVYDGARFDDGAFQYAAEDTTVVSVSESGELSGLKAGTTEITVTGEWRGFGENELSAVYPVRVSRDFSVQIGTPAVTKISSTANAPEGYDVPNTVQLTATVLDKGEEVSAASLVWTTSDSSVATVVNGLVTGHKAGKVSIGVQYTDSDNAVYEAIPVEITVEFPVLDRTETVNLGTIDVSDAFDTEEGLVISAQAVFGQNAPAITEIYDVTDGTAVKFSMETAASGDALVHETGNAIRMGYERVWEIRNAEYAYRVSLFAITRIINNAKDLLDSFEIVTTGSNNQVLYGEGYYYVLGQNIEATDTTRKEDSWTSDFKGSGGSGFQGEFDGRGYTINGLTLQNGGLFGNLAAGSVIQNFALTNVTLTTARADYQPAPIAYSIYGDAQIENVFIHINASTAPAANAKCGIRGIANMVRGSNTGTKPTIKDTVVYMNVGDAPAAPRAASLFTHYQSGNFAAFDNVHVISDYKFVAAENGGDNPTPALSGTVTRYGAGAAKTSFAAAFSGVDDVLATARLSADDWTYNEAIGYPVFTSFLAYYEEALNTAFEALPETLTYDVGAGGSFTVPAGCGVISVTVAGSPAGVTIAGNTVTVAKEAAAGTYTLTVTSTYKNSITKNIPITVLSEEQIAEREAGKAFKALDGKTFEFGMGTAASWSLADTGIDGLKAETFGVVTLAIEGDSVNGITIDNDTKKVLIDDTAVMGDVKVVITSVPYSGLSAKITVSILSTLSIDTLVELSQDEDDGLLTIDYSSSEAGADKGVSASYKTKDAAEFTAITSGVSFEAGKVLFTAEFLKTLPKAGVNLYVIRVKISDKVLEFTNITLYTDVIKDVAELFAAFKYPATNSTPVVYGRNTYYVLGQDIDASEIEDKAQKTQIRGYYLSGGTTEAGFGGTFDGKGHSINGIIVQSGGLFGHLASTADIKNFALTNLIIGGDSWQPVAIATTIAGGAKVDNVFIHISAVETTSAAIENVRAFANAFRVADANNKPNISSVILVVAAQIEEGVQISSFVEKIESVNNANFSNVHVVSDYYMLANNGSGSRADTQKDGYFKNVTRHSVADGYKATLSDSGYSETYWENNDGLNYTVFKSAVKYLLMSGE